MQNNNITISDAWNKLDDYLSKRVEIGYKKSTTIFDEENIRMFLNTYSNDVVFNDELIEAFLQTRYKNHKNRSRILGVKNSLIVFLDFLLTGIPYRKKQKNYKSPVSIYSDLVKKYIDSECLANLETTINRKIKSLTKFVMAVEMAEPGLKDITADFVIDYCSKSTIENSHYIKSFLLYLYKSSYLKYDASCLIKVKSRPVKIPSVYSDEEIKEISNYYNEENGISIRNKAIISLIVTTGLRSCDIADLKVENIEFDRHHITLNQKKTNVKISLYINPEVEKLLIKHLRINESKDGYVFHTVRYPFNKIDTGSIRYIVRKAINDLGYFKNGKKAGPHSLRSSFATSLVNDGYGYGLVEKALGHQSSDSLGSYVKTDIEKLRLCALPAIEPTGCFKEWLG